MNVNTLDTSGNVKLNKREQQQTICLLLMIYRQLAYLWITLEHQLALVT